jgi:hypothetical protein
LKSRVGRRTLRNAPRSAAGHHGLSRSGRRPCKVLAGRTGRGGSVPALSVKLHRSLWVSALVPAVVFLSSCSESTPVSQTAEVTEELSFNPGTHPRKVGLWVASTATLRSPTVAFPNGFVEIEVRARCPRPYVRQESGLLRIEQGLVSGEGSVQLQLGGCTGRWQSGTVRVEPFGDEPFHRGPARVSVQFDVVNPNDPTGEDVLSAGVNKQIRIR